MHDIRQIRENPHSFSAAMQRRGEVADGEELLALDEQRRRLIQDIESLRAQRNEISGQIATLRRGGSPAQTQQAAALGERVKQQKQQLEQANAQLKQVQEQLDRRLLTLPNILAASVPEGADESDNRLEREWGEKPAFAYTPRSHDELGARLGNAMDFAAAARISGARFVVLHHQLAKLERELAGFMLDLHTREHGYTEVSPPALVSEASVLGTGQLPKFADDLFRTVDGRYLIPTAEVPLTNLVRESVLETDVLPLRFTALTPCFRSEAGAAGRDTRGMLRQHQFNKVELVSITDATSSQEELHRMLGCAERVLQLLELPYRVVTLCSGDTGFSAQQTYDIEVWLPSQGCYREISSCSVCGAFQARRMNARYRSPSGKPEFVHTLNGSGVAVGRALIAILENGQEADGSIRLPAVMAQRMGCNVLRSVIE